MSTGEKRVTVYLESRTDRPHYLLCWVDPASGRVKSRTSRTADEREARKKAAVMEERLNAGEGPAGPGKPAALTWAEFRARYEAEHLAALAMTTRHGAAVALGKLERAARPKLLANADEDALAKVRRAMAADGLAAVTAANNLSHLRAALRWAARNKLLAAAPHVEMPRLSDPAPPQRLLDAAGYAALRAALPGPWRRFLDLGWYAGMRRTEILRLRWERTADRPHLDLAQRRVWFPPGKGSKSGRAECVAVHPDLAELLLPAAAEGRVCPGVPADPSKCSRGFRLACAAAGYDLRPHDLRRSFIDRFARFALPQELMELARHSNFQTTKRYYNLRPKLDELIRRADGPPEGARPNK